MNGLVYMQQVIKMNICLLIITICTACCLSSCSNSEDKAVASVDGHLTIITSVGGLGDMGYNDKIMSGIMNFYEGHDAVSMSLIRPNEIGEANQALQEWKAETKDKGKSLLVLASSEYETLVATNNLNLSENQQVLLFESKNPNLPEGVNTFCINRYGASYLAGCMAKEHKDATVIAAMPGDPILEESIDGFTNGYQAYSNNQVEVIYLSDSETGFALADSAYRVASGIHNAFIFPLAGGSNSGIYKYSRETDFYLPLIVGMDTDCSMYSDRIPFSMVVHIDKLVEQYLNDWLDDVPMEKTRTFGLESGMIDIVMSSVFYKDLDIWEEYYDEEDYWEKAYQAHKAEAIGKEDAYEKN